MIRPGILAEDVPALLAKPVPRQAAQLCGRWAWSDFRQPRYLLARIQAL